MLNYNIKVNWYFPKKKKIINAYYKWVIAINNYDFAKIYQKTIIKFK